MPITDAHHELRDLALLYLHMAHAADDYLSDVALASVTERVYAHSRTLDRARVQDIVMATLAQYTDAADVEALAGQAGDALHGRLTTAQKQNVLEDLMEIARADGVLLENERGLVLSLARRWGVSLRGAPSPEGAAAEGSQEPWSVLHDLAYIYLHLAHGTDHELNPQEVKVMVNKLREWQPEMADEPIEGVFETALEAYGRGDHEAMFARAIASVRTGLPHPQRMAALNDLVKIANADGVFLDDEEDMINGLLTAWDVDAYANYGAHGTK